MAAAASEGSAVSSAAGGVWSCCKATGSIIAKLCGCITRCVQRMSTRTVSIVLRVVNLANAVFLAAACVFAYGITAGSVTRFFLATYIGIFAFLLGAFELRVKWTEGPIRTNCGFMFTYTGRAALLIFLGAITFGMIDTSQGGNSDTIGFKVVVGAGVFTLLNSIFNCFVICSHPGFQELSKQAEEGFNRSAAGADPSKMSEAQIKAYLSQHPEVAAAAVASVQGQAAQPSDVETGAGVADWASGKKDGASSGKAADKASGGWFGRGGGNAGKPKSPAQADAAATAYVPPAVTTSPPSAPAEESNPFTSGASHSNTKAKSPPTASTPSPAHAHAPAPAPVRAPAPAPAPAPEEENPFASDNPFS